MELPQECVQGIVSLSVDTSGSTISAITIEYFV
jgi:hypothetical protein